MGAINSGYDPDAVAKGGFDALELDCVTGFDSRGKAAERDSTRGGADRERGYARSSHRYEQLELHHGIAGKSGDADGRAHVAAGFAKDFDE
jgi:hypothetical protein